MEPVVRVMNFLEKLVVITLEAADRYHDRRVS